MYILLYKGLYGVMVYFRERAERKRTEREHAERERPECERAECVS